MRTRRPILDRFWAFVQQGDGCWEWTGNKKARGYGVFGIARSKGVLAHRFAFEITNGPIPDGLHVCHKCDNPQCVRPDHLFLGTATDNMRDAAQKGRLRQPGTHCAAGHEFTADNTAVDPKSGKRRCRQCHNVRTAASRKRFGERHPERVRQFQRDQYEKNRDKRLAYASAQYYAKKGQVQMT